MVSTQSMKGEFIKSIKNEMYLLKKISHENIVKYIDFIQTEFHYSIILELIESGSLYGIIKKFGPFQESLAVIFIKQVLSLSTVSIPAPPPLPLLKSFLSINQLYSSYFGLFDCLTSQRYCKDWNTCIVKASCIETSKERIF